MADSKIINENIQASNQSARFDKLDENIQALIHTMQNIPNQIVRGIKLDLLDLMTLVKFSKQCTPRT